MRSMPSPAGPSKAWLNTRLRDALARKPIKRPAEATYFYATRSHRGGMSPRRPSPLPHPAAGGHNLPVPADQLRRARAGAGRGRRLLATTRLLTLTGAGRLGQDPAGAGGRRASRSTRTPTASGWSSWRRWPTRPWCRRRSPPPWACGSSRAARSSATLADALRARRAAAGAGQLRAPARRLRRAGRGAAAGLPRPARPGHQPRGAGVAGEVAWRVPSLALPDAASAADRRRSCARYEAVRLFVERARAVQPAFALTEQNARGRGRDLPPAGRHPAGARAGGGAGAGAVGRADRRAAGRPLPAADRRQRGRRCRASRRCGRRSTGATTC